MRVFGSYGKRAILLVAALFATSSHAAKANAKSGRFAKYQEMAKAGRATGNTAYVKYTARQMQEAIQFPIRAMQVEEGDTNLAMLMRVQNSGYDDHMALLDELFQSPQLDELWVNPKVASTILDNMPIFKAVKGIPEIAAKGENITPEDGTNALKILRDWSAKSVEIMTLFNEDPDNFIGDVMRTYKELGETDTQMKNILELAAKGNKEAALDLQRFIVKDLFDDLLDMDALGLGGTEPEQHIKQKEFAMSNDLFASIMGDNPEGLGFVLDPTTIRDQAAKLVGLEAGSF